jgi:hypothetical protein
MKWLPLILLAAVGCGGGGDGGDPGADSAAMEDTAGADILVTGDATADLPLPRFQTVGVLVTLDGAPAEGVTLSQGGREDRWTTDGDGRTTVEVDRTVEGDLVVIAAHPEARTEGDWVWDDTTEITIALERYDPEDNEAYVFQNPGEPGHSPTSAQCGHCHVTIAEDFFGSRHPGSVTNPVLQDLYAGTAAALDSEASCEAAGGSWWTGLIPGEEIVAGDRCYIGDGVLPALNDDCGDDAPCDGTATVFGGCADCHAPGLDGALGGRDLLEADGIAYTRGIHCDVCHHVESVDDDGAPGIAGRLRILRPSDPALTPSFGDWRPLLFGPHDDIPNPFMGIVQRMVFRESRFCAGCHQLDQEVLVPGAVIDAARWPGGTLPIHSTLTEWSAGTQGVTCQGCHMPHDPDVANTADLQLFPSTVGVAGGWHRPAPSVRRHVWFGPRSTGDPLQGLAGTVALETARADGVLTVTAETRNAGAGHALPTGDPLRSVLLVVEARCGDTTLAPLGGHVVPDFGGALDRKAAGEDWTTWPGAAAGDVLRVVARPGGFHDYAGPGPFGDGSFDAAAKGMPVETYAGQATITGVEGDVVTLDGPLPEGAVAYRVPGQDTADLAGAPGFGFAKVLVGPNGRRMVPHFLAVDIASDNRLLQGNAWTTTHLFEATCDQPTVRARLLYRPYPLDLARERLWEVSERVLFDTGE